MIGLLVFLFFAALALAAAVLVVVQKNVMHSVLYLAFAVLATAGVFFSLQAEYLGAIQILVYAGGIVVLYIFVIVIVNLKEVVPERRPLLAKIVLVAVPVATGVEIAWLLVAGGFPAAAPVGEGRGFRAVAETLFASYLFPFELASVLLLAVLVGAIIVARRKLVHDPD
ncbi:MAG: NADH-quinone oxidoreductase subunit J [Candidatus Aminicenantes bacterium]|nr:NADH-quinone oxidoreductase subunit J [Candidatus Aminicenantes bacterium]NLH75988.1 NADH-quinone oxidoreductase subunit J [Acidobacteriota bacterium]